MDKATTEFAPPLIIYMVFGLAAFIIGPQSSCHGGLEAYTVLGLIGLPALLAVPLLYSKQRHVAAKIGLAGLYFLLGVVAWGGSFLLGGMNFMCRLF